MNRTLTAAAALLASSAGAAGFAGTATAAPASELPATPALDGAAKGVGEAAQANALPQPVGGVVPALPGGSAENTGPHLPLVGNGQGTPVEPVLKTINGATAANGGDKSASADPIGAVGEAVPSPVDGKGVTLPAGLADAAQPASHVAEGDRAGGLTDAHNPLPLLPAKGDVVQDPVGKVKKLVENTPVGHVKL